MANLDQLQASLDETLASTGATPEHDPSQRLYRPTICQSRHYGRNIVASALVPSEHSSKSVQGVCWSLGRMAVKKNSTLLAALHCNAEGHVIACTRS